ncbi:hypothetical protein FOZ60_003588 [Perkinsus olseni]|uniref:Uncharacterized protein n=1 Tax=Perkinsus olseni TaxID=32597 RepID=A0A7J6NXB9_PEROL|nr:hypothetical protein FOZ60_003588 [Perkinsus olseni]
MYQSIQRCCVAFLRCLVGHEGSSSRESLINAVNFTETSTENLLKRLAYTEQRIQELQEWEVAFLAEWNLEVMLSDFCGRGAAYRQILKKPYGLQKRNMMNCGESKRNQRQRRSPGRWTRNWNDNLISDFEARRTAELFLSAANPGVGLGRMAADASTSCSPSESSTTYCLVDDPWKDI